VRAEHTLGGTNVALHTGKADAIRLQLLERACPSWTEQECREWYENALNRLAKRISRVEPNERRGLQLEHETVRDGVDLTLRIEFSWSNPTEAWSSLAAAIPPIRAAVNP
jgi:hypothetical protein